MNLKEEKVIGPTKELREYMESLKKRPPLGLEKREAQFRRFKKFRESKEYQDQERLEREAAKKFTEEWHKKHGV